MMPPESFQPGWKHSPGWFALVLEQAKAELKLTREVPLNEIVGSAPLREAQKELGLRK
jgi:hypothetical protein